MWPINARYFEKLPADVQKVLLEEGKKAGDEMTRLTLELQNDYMDKFKSAGVTFVTDVDTAAFQASTAPVYKYLPRSGPPTCTRPCSAHCAIEADAASGGETRQARWPVGGPFSCRGRPFWPWPRLSPTSFEEVVACIALAVVVLAVSWGVITRYIIAQPAAWASELATLAFAWLVFFGATACIKYRLHPNIDMVVRRSLKACKSACAGSIMRC